MEHIHTVKNDFKIFFLHHILSGVIDIHFWQFHGTFFPEILIGLSEAVPKKVLFAEFATYHSPEPLFQQIRVDTSLDHLNYNFFSEQFAEVN